MKQHQNINDTLDYRQNRSDHKWLCGRALINFQYTIMYEILEEKSPYLEFSSNFTDFYRICGA